MEGCALDESVQTLPLISVHHSGDGDLEDVTNALVAVLQVSTRVLPPVRVHVGKELGGGGGEDSWAAAGQGEARQCSGNFQAEQCLSPS